MKSLEASPEAKPKLMLLGTKLVDGKDHGHNGAGLIIGAEGNHFEGEIAAAPQETGETGLCRWESAPGWARALVGSEPSTVYHICALAVMSETVNWAALLPVMHGIGGDKLDPGLNNGAVGAAVRFLTDSLDGQIGQYLGNRIEGHLAGESPS